MGEVDGDISLVSMNRDNCSYPITNVILLHLTRDIYFWVRLPHSNRWMASLYRRKTKIA